MALSGFDFSILRPVAEAAGMALLVAGSFVGFAAVLGIILRHRISQLNPIEKLFLVLLYIVAFTGLLVTIAFYLTGILEVSFSMPDMPVMGRHGLMSLASTDAMSGVGFFAGADGNPFMIIIGAIILGFILLAAWVRNMTKKAEKEEKAAKLKKDGAKHQLKTTRALSKRLQIGPIDDKVPQTWRAQTRERRAANEHVARDVDLSKAKTREFSIWAIAIGLIVIIALALGITWFFMTLKENIDWLPLVFSGNDVTSPLTLALSPMGRGLGEGTLGFLFMGSIFAKSGDRDSWYSRAPPFILLAAFAFLVSSCAPSQDSTGIDPFIAAIIVALVAWGVIFVIFKEKEGIGFWATAVSLLSFFAALTIIANIIGPQDVTALTATVEQLSQLNSTATPTFAPTYTPEPTYTPAPTSTLTPVSLESVLRSSVEIESKTAGIPSHITILLSSIVLWVVTSLSGLLGNDVARFAANTPKMIATLPQGLTKTTFSAAGGGLGKFIFNAIETFLGAAGVTYVVMFHSESVDIALLSGIIGLVVFWIGVWAKSQDGGFSVFNIIFSPLPWAAIGVLCTGVLGFIWFNGFFILLGIAGISIVMLIVRWFVGNFDANINSIFVMLGLFTFGLIVYALFIVVTEMISGSSGNSFGVFPAVAMVMGLGRPGKDFSSKLISAFKKASGRRTGSRLASLARTVLFAILTIGLFAIPAPVHAGAKIAASLTSFVPRNDVGLAMTFLLAFAVVANIDPQKLKKEAKTLANRFGRKIRDIEQFIIDSLNGGGTEEERIKLATKIVTEKLLSECFQREAERLVDGYSEFIADLDIESARNLISTHVPSEYVASAKRIRRAADEAGKELQEQALLLKAQGLMEKLPAVTLATSVSITLKDKKKSSCFS